MNFRSVFFSVCFTITAATASGSSDDLTRKLFDAAGSDRAAERYVSQLISSIERGKIDQVTQQTIQTFFQIAPDGRLTEAALALAQQRNVARTRARLMGQYLIHDLNGDGAISAAEMEDLLGPAAAQVLSLRALADANGDGALSTDELLAAATASASENMRHDQNRVLMVFDLNDDDIVVADEVLTALRTLAGEALSVTPPSGGLYVTTGTFAAPSDEPETIENETTNADGLPIELHMVGIYEPITGRFGNPLVSKRLPVQIKVDRPGVAVKLVLGSYEAAKWNIETTEGTVIDTIIVSSRNRPRGEFTLNGEGVAVRFADLPVAYQARGNRFQPFHMAAAEAARVENASSFDGAYRAPKEGFVIEEAPGVPTRDEVEAALRVEVLAASELPQKLRDAFEGKIEAPGASWALRDEGFVGKSEDQTILHKLPLDAPEVSWPVGVAYDPTGKTLWGVTFGGEGYLYEFDIEEERWTARSMNNVDVGGIIFDPETGNLITTPGSFGRSGYMVMDQSAKVLSTLEVSVNDYPGLIDSFDPGNGPRPRIVPIKIEGDLLLVRAEPELRQTHRRTSSGLVYLVNLNDGKVRLVR